MWRCGRSRTRRRISCVTAAPTGQGRLERILRSVQWLQPLRPAAHLGISSAFAGWPKIDEIEALREKWCDELDLAGRQAIARQIQLLVWRDAPYVPLGSYYPPTAFKGNLTGALRGGATFFTVRRG